MAGKRCPGDGFASNGPFHSGTFRTPSTINTQNADPVEQTNREYHVRNAAAAMVLSGVFERFPKLKVGVIEFEIRWAPYFMTRLDDTYKYRSVGQRSYRYKNDALLSPIP